MPQNRVQPGNETMVVIETTNSKEGIVNLTIHDQNHPNAHTRLYISDARRLPPSRKGLRSNQPMISRVQQMTAVADGCKRIGWSTKVDGVLSVDTVGIYSSAHTRVTTLTVCHLAHRCAPCPANARILIQKIVRFANDIKHAPTQVKKSNYVNRLQIR